MINRDRILAVVSRKGPVLPLDIAKELQTNTIIASAQLSELVSAGHLKISNVKVGGSPVYFLPGQEELLQRYYGQLHEKEKRAYDLLKGQTVLWDSKQEPVTRVALRGIKDFAVPLKAHINGRDELIWKWYLLSNQGADSVIRRQLSPPEPEQEKQNEGRAEEPKKERAKAEEPKFLKPKGAPAEPRKPASPDAPFGELVTSFFTENNIKVVDKTAQRKTEIDYVVRIPSAVGELTYFCKAKSKKRVSDGDLSSAYVQGGMKKLPILFVTTGELTKKALELLDAEFKNMKVKRL
ncbi:MAG: hypothetical protein ABH879_10310 [archaeon]